jgi:type II secretory pathway pseudopilin PulG
MAGIAANPFRPPRRGARRSFTLLELLAVMGIVLALTTLTAVSVGNLARDANRTAATNTVVAMLGTARSIALRDNAYVALTFRVAPDRQTRAIPSDPQVVELVVAKWTGEVVTDVNGDRDVFADRFVPVPGIASKRLPPGILVAGPAFSVVTDQTVGANDRFWITQPRFEGTVTPVDQATGRPGFLPDLGRTELGWAIAVLFGPDGRMLSRNPEAVLEVDTSGGGGSVDNAYVKAFVDYDGDGRPRKGATVVPPYPADANVQWAVYDEPSDEPVFDYVPYLAVFSDIEAKEVFPLATAGSTVLGSWRGSSINSTGSGGGRRRQDLSQFIEQQSDRITFNRYSGVAVLEVR